VAAQQRYATFWNAGGRHAGRGARACSLSARGAGRSCQAPARPTRRSVPEGDGSGHKAGCSFGARRLPIV